MIHGISVRAKSPLTLLKLHICSHFVEAELSYLMSIPCKIMSKDLYTFIITLYRDRYLVYVLFINNR